MYISSNYDLQIPFPFGPQKSHRLLRSQLAKLLAFETKIFFWTHDFTVGTSVEPTQLHRRAVSSRALSVYRVSEELSFGFSSFGISFLITSSLPNYHLWIISLDWFGHRLGYPYLSSFNSTWFDFGLPSIIENFLHQHNRCHCT